MRERGKYLVVRRSTWSVVLRIGFQLGEELFVFLESLLTPLKRLLLEVGIVFLVFLISTKL